MLLPPLREKGDVREQVDRGLEDIECVIAAKIPAVFSSSLKLIYLRRIIIRVNLKNIWQIKFFTRFFSDNSKLSCILIRGRVFTLIFALMEDI